MNAAGGVILSVAYILGLLSTCLLSTSASWQWYWGLALGVGALGVGAASQYPDFGEKALNLDYGYLLALLA
jgi:hypothetical protein